MKLSSYRHPERIAAGPLVRIFALVAVMLVSPLLCSVAAAQPPAGDGAAEAATEAATEQTAGEYTQNRAPLLANAYRTLPLGQIEPEGWLRDIQQRMAAGMTGHLDELYGQVVGPRNGWLGGDGDGWERGPYWIDGLLPLAYQLDDERLKAKVQPWVEWTLQNQREDGYLGPIPFDEPPPKEPGLQKVPRRDWWPKMVMLKILKNYYTATGDERVIEALDRYFRYQLRELPSQPLDHWSNWAKKRGGDNLLIVLWLYNQTGEEYLLDLARLLHEQTYPHTDQFLGPNSPLARRRGMHCVNIAQGMKHPVVMYQMDGNQRHLQAVDQGFADLQQHFGLPTGLYGADEPLNSKEPTTGSEFCTAVEMMFSLEKMFEITGRIDYADRLEQIAFNVVPTQATDDFLGKQYYSLVNQPILAHRESRAHLTDHGGEDHLFGVLTGYPCCTTNLHQGWPKFTQHLWMASPGGGLAAVAYAPCRVTARVAGGQHVTISERGNYPFGDTVTLEMSTDQPVAFPLQLRIPQWCERAEIHINGVPHDEYAGGQMATIKQRWKDGDVVTLGMPMTVKTSRWYGDAVSFHRGPLLYALRIGERWKQVGDQRDGGYREVHPTDPWQYGVLEEDLQQLNEHFQVSEVEEIPANPWTLDTAPVRIEGRGVLIDHWKLHNQTATPTPRSPVLMLDPQPAPITLIPYGSTTLRIAEFPAVRQGQPPEKPLEQKADATASHVWQGDSLQAIQDGLVPAEGEQRSFHPRMTWWDHRGGSEWAQLSWDKPKEVSRVAVYWFDDTGQGSCRVPESWRLLYRDGEEWKPVEARSEYAVATGRFNEVAFAPVTTDSLRLEVKLRDGFSSGVLEWRVDGPGSEPRSQR